MISPDFLSIYETENVFRPKISISGMPSNKITFFFKPSSFLLHLGVKSYNAK